MGRNRRLADALRHVGWNAAQLSEKLGVDPKTVDRWVSTGRTPHPRLRDAAAAALGVPAAVLWPEAEAATGGVAELVALYPTRAELSPATVASLVAGAIHHLDVLAYAGLWLWDAVPGFARALVEKIDAGCSVRLCLGDPDSPAVRLRGEDEGIGDGLAARCRLALTYAQPVIDRDPGAVRCSGQTLYTSLLRIDNEVLLNTHFWGNPANASPVLHLRRQGDFGVAANAQRSFERVWASSSAPPGAP